MRRLTDDAHRDVTELLSSHREQLENLAAALLEVETLDGIDAYRAAGLPIDPSSSQRVPQSIYDTL